MLAAPATAYDERISDGSSLLADPRAHQRARMRCCGRSRCPTIDHRGPEFQALGRRLLEKIKPVFGTTQPGADVPGHRHRRVGGGAGQHAQPRGPGAVLRDRALRHAVAGDGDGLGARRRLRPRRLAARGRPRRGRASGCAPTPGTRSAPSACVHNETSTGVTSRIAEVRAAIDAAGASGPVPGRHDLLARLHRLPARRVEGRRHRRRLAEGADAAARDELQRGERQGPGGAPVGRGWASRCGTGRRS